MNVIDYLQYCAQKYKLKYVEYNHLDYRFYRLYKSSTEYILVSSRPDGTFGFFDRIGDSGCGGFDATVENVDSSLKRMGVISDVEQLTLFCLKI